jgi:hypothetical protein
MKKQDKIKVLKNQVLKNNNYKNERQNGKIWFKGELNLLLYELIY